MFGASRQHPYPGHTPGGSDLKRSLGWGDGPDSGKTQSLEPRKSRKREKKHPKGQILVEKFLRPRLSREIVFDFWSLWIPEQQLSRKVSEPSSSAGLVLTFLPPRVPPGVGGHPGRDLLAGKGTGGSLPLRPVQESPWPPSRPRSWPAR